MTIPATTPERRRVLLREIVATPPRVQRGFRSIKNRLAIAARYCAFANAASGLKPISSLE
jgi:hypothetical protein